MKRKLTNRGEQLVHDEIVGVVSTYQAEIYRRIRIADVIDISKLSDRSRGTFALQSHFDICVGDERKEPAFAIEYDGAGHDGRNDERKNEIAREAGLALFRVSELLLDRRQGGVTFLQYLAHTWFLGREFMRMREAGEIDSDEPFFMSGFLKPDAQHIFDSEFNFTGIWRGRINRLAKQAGQEWHQLAHCNIAHSLLAKGDSSFVGLASVPIAGRMAYGRARLDIGTPSLGELGELPFGWSALSDFCEGMALEDLCANIEMQLGSGGHAARTEEEMYAEIEALAAQGYRVLRSGWGGGNGGMIERVNKAFRADAMPSSVYPPSASR
ncbi:DUF2726 domain-containing protein [Sphingomonas sp. LB-2]|uniref:DUF2726 domain-containing protein n=1 Tax=Sphingomonas caeni TaxID=2984949 RepID=UPI00222E3A43|nr:DUF2726 domain-containing protein [Sphingomonas caeni]MCW3847362.1 DUF2726 domain-containing protein [Sphingomonas caeni]